VIEKLNMGSRVMKNKNPLIYIIEDEEKMREIFRINLSSKYNIKIFKTAEEAFADFKKDRPQLIVTDVKLPGMDGITFMEQIKRIDSTIPFIVFTGYGSIDHAVETMKKGAFDYLVKPIKISQLEQSIKRAISYIEIASIPTRVELEKSFSFEEEGQEFLTWDPSTIQVLQLCKKAARFKSPILITGETGTGKELIARYIHKVSGRKGLFVNLNCASIPRELLEGELFGYKKGSFTGAIKDYEGKIALSDGGTLFLDEIGEMPIEIQAKLLSVLEIPEYYPIGSNVKKRVDLFLLSATNKNLRKMVDEGSFRQDLYYRIAVIPINIPPLRERKADIIPLSEYFLSKHGDNYILSPEAKLELLSYNWPGNVRELKNVIERSILMSDNERVIRKIFFDADVSYKVAPENEYGYEDIPTSWEDFKKYKTRQVKGKKEELEKIFIQKLLIANNGNVSASARAAGIDRRQLQDMMKSLGIDPSIFRSK